jgi:hypothetical protein
MVILTCTGAVPSSNLCWPTQGLSEAVLFLTDILNIFHSPIYLKKQN